MKNVCIGFVIAVLALLALPAAAETFDGSEPLVCAHLESVECTADRQCEHGSAHHVRIPSLVTLDVKKKRITDIVSTVSPVSPRTSREARWRQPQSYAGRSHQCGV